MTVNRPLFSQSTSPLRNSYGPLRKTILSSMILVPIVIYLLALGIGYFYFMTSLQNSSLASIKRILGDHGQMIDTFLEERKSDLAFITDTYSYTALKDPETLRQILKQLQHKSSAFVDLGIFDNNGVHVNYQGPYDLSGKIYKDEPWFKAVLENGVYISDVFLGFRKIPHFIIAMEKHSPSQTWIIRATIDTYLFNTLVEHVSIGKTGEAYLLNTKGLLQTRRPSSGSLMEEGTLDHRPPEFHQGLKISIQKDRQGNEQLYATTWLKNKLWMLVVKQDKADAFHTLNTATYLIILTTVIGVMIIILVSFYFTARIVRRLETMDSEKEKLRFQLIHASGLAELGEMATGFAHEINNPLQIIKSELALIQMDLAELIEKAGIQPSETQTELTDSLSQIDLQINRCSQITHAILKFGRRSEPETQTLDLNQFIPEIITMVDKRASVQGIDIRLDPDSRLQFIKADPAQLQQVFLNLFNNAIDAITEKHGSAGGMINLSVDSLTKEGVVISITDNGIGISDENIKKVFTPFFTTKPVGKGTGLGLSVCYGIIKNMGGDMAVSSRNGNGTVFKISLPVERSKFQENKSDDAR
ncbi:GHKL domain-containing protein [bacterium]|nr:GHKL domain-containing protein [bacterium]